VLYVEDAVILVKSLKYEDLFKIANNCISSVKKKNGVIINNLQLNLIKPKYVIYKLFKNDYQLGNNNDSKKIE